LALSENECAIVFPNAILTIINPTKREIYSAFLENIGDSVLGAGC